MSLVLIGGLGSNLYCVLLFATGLFLILLILVQRGRGGGLSGAFGGAGGQSAFGTKAGDTFTRITMGVASFWIVLCILGARFAGTEEQGLMSADQDQQMGAPLDPAEPGIDSDLTLGDVAPSDNATTDTPAAEAPSGETPPAEITSDPIE